MGGDGYLTISEFVTMNFNEELSDLGDAKVVSDWQEGIVRSFYSWKQYMSEIYTSGNAALLNFMGAHNGPNTRTSPASFDGPTDGLSIAGNVVDAIIDPIGTGHGDWTKGCIDNAPCRVGSHAPGARDLQYIQTFIQSGCQPSFSMFPAGSCSFEKNFLFILDASDSNYWDDIFDKP